jgi:L-lactate dehydrogenase
MKQLCSYPQMRDQVCALFGAAGLAPERALVMAEALLEADLLGFETHGLRRVPSNIDWLLDGTTRAHGDPVVLRDLPTGILWDATCLPGPWVLARALELIVERTALAPVACIAIRRSQHVACLAAALSPHLNGGRLLLLAASSPTERVVAAAGGVTGVLSTNPIAYLLPAGDDPLIADFSTSIVSLGHIAKARAAGTKLAARGLVRGDGSDSDDPHDRERAPLAALLPIGGLEHGFKGYALSLLVEALSAGLAGDAEVGTTASDETNAVFALALNPEALAGRASFERRMRELQNLCRRSGVAPGAVPVRTPGERALALRRQRLVQGIPVGDELAATLNRYAHRLGCPASFQERSMSTISRG